MEVELNLPPGTDVVCAREVEALPDVRSAIAAALSSPIGSPPFPDLCRQALERMTMPDSTVAPSVVVVVSDHSRPVPYKGESGILWPLVDELLRAGLPPEWITILVATGTHHPLADEEIWELLDGRVREVGVRVASHDAADPALLVPAGRTGAGVDVSVNRVYVEAGLRILTGLVEPHFAAGASGGRKSICPGLVDVRSVRDFHGPSVVASEGAGGLCLEANSCHELALEVASLVPADFIVNVTTGRDGRVTGVFAGDMREAHLAAVGLLKTLAEVHLEHEYDIVITHAAKVGINHYQAGKALGSAAPAVRPGGYLVLLADNTDLDPVGSASYRRLLQVLAQEGPHEFQRLIQEDEWEFAQDQWAVQMYAMLLERIPRDHLFYFSPQTRADDYAFLPCRDPGSIGLAGAESGGFGPAAGDSRRLAVFVEAAVERAAAECRARLGREPRILCIADGPHCVPRPAPPARASLSGT